MSAIKAITAIPALPLPAASPVCDTIEERFLMQFFYDSALISSLGFLVFSVGIATKVVFAILFLLGALIFIHELGHYAMAKLFGVRVETFSLGFGKRLWGFRRGDTDYRISLLPLGGYVKMAGENPMEERTGDPGEFMSHPRWQRFVIAIAGPVMNIILAVVLLTGVNMVHYEPPPLADIGWVAPNSPAAQAGIQPGDRIIKIQNIQNPRWDDVRERVAVNPKQTIALTVRRGGQIIDTKLTPAEVGADRQGDAGWEPPDEGVIGAVLPGKPAANAGVKAGDIIVSLNGSPVDSIREAKKKLQEIKSGPLQLAVLRQGKQLDFNLQAEQVDNNGKQEYLIGIYPGQKKIVSKLPFREALATAYADCKKNSSLIFELVRKMLQGKNSIKQVSGPVGIVQITAAAAMTDSWPIYLNIMALISINLAVFNLFPIPILDGGLMLMLLIESIMRRDIKQEVKERVYQAAFVFLLLFAAVVIYNDVAKSFARF
jgi:regulator of sigma E protease